MLAKSERFVVDFIVQDQWVFYFNSFEHSVAGCVIHGAKFLEVRHALILEVLREERPVLVVTNYFATSFLTGGRD